MDENRTNPDKKVGPHRNLFGRISNIRRLPISDKVPIGIPEGDPRGLARSLQDLDRSLTDGREFSR